jgi:hypothetical protein
MEIRQFLLTNLLLAPGGSTGGGAASFRIPLDIIDEAIANLGGFPYAPGERTWRGPTLAIRGNKSK